MCDITEEGILILYFHVCVHACVCVCVGGGGVMATRCLGATRKMINFVEQMTLSFVSTF